ncbi:unnamed protein product [Clonostachys byssicola]|uniref:Carboxylic ester hydrolase n=1 Tax=Clonostachys byssicola TaxID=160290 RepID=A0A9N9UAF6_9HYPO|nr:unnamed protein product [Clonostachys byssicola]
MKLAHHSFAFLVTAVSASSAPAVVQVRNGTYTGLVQDSFDQHHFLGIPYAQPPVGALRFKPPQSLSSSWSGSRNAAAYAPACWSPTRDNLPPGSEMSEDCLAINVVRPAGVKANDELPVAVWIHGGGLVDGSSSESSYNLSFIVNKSVEMGTPIVAASFNYRLNGWGLLYGNLLHEEGSSHLGYRDQRLALHWLQENIAAFGGDPEQVTIFGESAGAWSVGAQLLAHGGRDDGLFRGAVMQSGAPVWPEPNGPIFADDWEPYYQHIVSQTGCANTTDTLSCLRDVPAGKLTKAFEAPLEGFSRDWGHVVDGDFFETTTQKQIAEGKLPRVPLLMGINTDEGTSFAQQGINTDDEFLNLVRATGVDEDGVRELAKLYPDDPAVGTPATLHGRPSGDLAYLGAQYKRVAAFAGDLIMHGPRRLMTDALAKTGATLYSYHFNVTTDGPHMGATHFAEVPFVFNSIEQQGGSEVPKHSKELANIMSRMWISFFINLDPNYNEVSCLKWPLFEEPSRTNFVFDVHKKGNGYLEKETLGVREEAIKGLIKRMYPLDLA